jgi:ABC-type transport system involved in cytochrome bd biosynthesis fused ATPase/permease subunit
VIASLRVLVSALPARLRASLFTLALVHASLRVGMAFTLEGLVRGGARALALGLATGAVWAVVAAVRSALRHRVRVGLFRASAEALLWGEVSEAPREGESPHAVLAAVFEGERVLADALPMTLADGLAALVLAVLAALRLPPAFVAALACAAAVGVVLLVTVRRLLARAQDEANRAQRELFARWLEAKDGSLELAAAALEDIHLGRIEAASTRWLRATAKLELGAALLGRGPMAALALGLGAVAWTTLGRGEGGLALTAFLAATAAPLAGLASALSELGRSLGRAEPLVHRLKAPRRAEPAYLVAEPGDVLEGDALAAGYGERPIFAGLSLRWSRGTPLVPEGPNGAGKTTLLRTLVGLRAPREGALRWRGSPGGLSARLPIAFLPQRAHLAQESSVRDALHMLAPEASDDELWAAITKVELRDRLTSTGLETLVGTLSIGQRQRLALARVLLLNAELVVLDEPDANLDRQGRALIDELVRELARDRFVALVAHGDLRRPEHADVVSLRAREQEKS